MEQTKEFINVIMQMWLMIYSTGQEVYIFFVTPVNEMVADNEDFFGILGSIEYTPFELMFGLGLLMVMMTSLVKFFKIDLV